MTRPARQYAPKHIGLNEKDKYKIFHAAGRNPPTVLRSSGFFSPGLPKYLLPILLILDAAQRSSRKPAAFRPPGTRCWPSRPAFSRQAAADKAIAIRHGSTWLPHTTGAHNWRTYLAHITGARMAVQHRAARAQTRQAAIIGLDEPPGQVHSVPACKGKTPPKAGQGQKV